VNEVNIFLLQTTYETTNPALVCSCLDVIGAYVSWIDINLIANDRFVTVLLRFMSVLVLRESACDCVHEIICKGMDPAAKTALIESFTAVLKTAGVLRRIEEVGSVYFWCFMLFFMA
jgi:exportin-T